jgi:hypothetical protein
MLKPDGEPEWCELCLVTLVTKPAKAHTIQLPDFTSARQLTSSSLTGICSGLSSWTAPTQDLASTSVKGRLWWPVKVLCSGTRAVSFRRGIFR